MPKLVQSSWFRVHSKNKKSTNYQLRTTNSSGFTLIELLVVISIISILSVVGFSAFTNVTKSSRDAKRRADIDAISKAYEVKYDQDNSQYKPLDTAAFTSGTIPQDPNPTKGYYYNWLDTDKSGFRMCASLEASGNIPCTTSAAQCYCKDSTQGKVKLSPIVGAYIDTSGVPNPIYADAATTHTDLGPGSLNPAPSCDTAGTLTAGLVGYWKMDNNINDSFGNNINGSLTGSAMGRWGSGCVSGGCTQTNADNDAVTINNSSLLNLASAFTYNIWFRFSSTYTLNPTNYRWTQIMSNKNGDTHRGYGIRYRFNPNLSTNQGTLYFEYGYQNGAVCGEPNYASINLGISLLDNQWHMATVTFDGTVIRTYLDGNPANGINGTVALGVFCDLGATNLILGQRYGGTSNISIDEARIYNRVLSPQEVKDSTKGLWGNGSGCIPQ